MLPRPVGKDFKLLLNAVILFRDFALFNSFKSRTSTFSVLSDTVRHPKTTLDYRSQFDADSNICVQGLTRSLQPSSVVHVGGSPFFLIHNSPSRILFCISNERSGSSSTKGLSPITLFFNDCQSTV